MEKVKLISKTGLTRIRDLDGSEQLELLAARVGDVTLVFRRAQMLGENEVAVEGEMLGVRFRNGNIEQALVFFPRGIYRIRMKALEVLGSRAQQGLD